MNKLMRKDFCLKNRQFHQKEKKNNISMKINHKLQKPTQII